MLAFDPIDEARAHWETHGWGDAAAGMAVVTTASRSYWACNLTV